MAATAPLLRDVILRDGTVARLRSPRPEDAPAIQAFYAGLPEEDRWLRFHGPGRPEQAARSLAGADGESQVALLAHRGGELLGVAEYAVLHEPGVAEVAFTTSPSARGIGLATRMLEQLAAIGAERGIHRFEAEVVAHNRPMLHVFQRTGFDVGRHSSIGEVHVELDIRPTEALAERIAERDHVATVASLRALLAPRSVAVVGASAGGTGGQLLTSIVAGGFCGVAGAVNRSGGVVASMRAVASVGELPEAPELLVVAVPAAEVLGVVDEAARAGVRAVLVVSAGFADADTEEGVALQDELLRRVRERGLRLVGPNSLGVVATAEDVRLRALLGEVPLRPGGLALSSQSGALGVALLGHVAARRLGVSSFVSLGNRADVSTNDLLEWWEADEATRVVLLYVESFGNPRRFAQICRRVARAKPIVIVKGARTRAAREGGSRTAAALDGEAPVDALLRSAGVLRVGSTQALFDVAQLLERQPLTRGRGVAVVTNSGGLGTLASDAIAAGGLELAPLAPATVERLAAALPGADRTTNPVDMGIGAHVAEHAAALEALLADDGVDAVVALHADLGGAGATPVLAALEAGAREATKPVLASVVAADGRLPEREVGWRVPNHRFPESAIAALALSAERREWLGRRLGQPARPAGVDAEAAAGLAAGLADGWLADADAAALLGCAGLPLLPTVACSTPQEAEAAAGGAASALKGIVAAPAQAGDVDAVLLGHDVRAGWDEVRRRIEASGRPWRGAVVQPLAPAGADVLVGVVADPDLGPIVGLGPGGRQGTATAFRLAPLADVDVEDLIDDVPAVAGLLHGLRFGAPLSREALADVVARLAALAEAVPRLAECDLNPVRVHVDGAVVLDARVRLAEPTARRRPRAW